VSFGRLEVCPDCTPSSLLDPADVAPRTPSGCVEVDDHEQWHTERSIAWAKHADAILAGEVEIGEDADTTTIAVKADDAARKHRAAAAVFTQQRARRAYIEGLRKERERIRKGWGSAN
jgi:hypothetical protein